MFKKWILPGCLLLVILAGCKSGSEPTAKPEADAVGVSQTKLFPDFKVKGFDGKEIALSQYRGKILILDLFATWCPPCRMEIPHFVELQQAYKDKVNVVGLSFDQGSAKDVQAFARDMKINYAIYWGSEEIAQHVGLRGIPHTLVIDAEGHVIKSYVGYREKEVFEKDIQALLGTGKP